MLSQVVGSNVGVAKRATAIVVKCPSHVKAECFYDALTKIYDEVLRESYQDVVISMSLYFQPTVLMNVGWNNLAVELWRLRTRIVLRRLAAMGVVLVTGSGNEGVCCPIHSLFFSSEHFHRS